MLEFIHGNKIAKYIAIVCATTILVGCDMFPGNDKDRWKFYQEIHVQGGTTGGTNSAISNDEYELHENSYYGGSSGGVHDYRSNYEPYKPYEPGKAKQYYRGDTDE